MPTELLRADPSHLSPLLELMREFYHVEHLHFDESIAKNGLGGLFLNQSYGHVYLIQFAGKTVGYTVLTFGYSLEFHGRDALVDELYVREQHRGKGIGASALSQIQEICRSEGVTALHLEVDRRNVRAQKLYHNSGFQDHDRYLLTKWLT